MVGQTLAHYKILEKIGSGGMGDVYLAEDTELDRKIALKVLPPDLAESEKRRARFKREAKAIAALNHPNIVQVYSVEEADGVHFITMELVQGRTLAELLPKKGFPLDKFFDIAIPLSDAVASPHEHGIVHRDLKPGNVMVTDDGRVKVLDFGLAVPEIRPLVGGGASESPTRAKTEEGHIVGTVHYMSPEQAEGKAVDHRTDIFSLGIVLYEMATGERPFRGDTTTSVLSSILKDTPVSISEVDPELPSELAKILRRCLAKDPEDRLQAAKDLRNELRELQEESGQVVSLHPSRRSQAWKVWGLAGAFVLLILMAWLVGRRPPEATRFANAVQITSALGQELWPSWSPDGARLAYQSDQSGGWDIWVTELGSGNPLNRTSDYEGADTFPVWSPDGRYIAFRSERDGGGIFIMSALAGSPRRVSRLGANVSQRPQWSLDATELAYVVREPESWFIEIASLETEGFRRVALPSETNGCWDLSWSPNGRIFAYVNVGHFSNDYPALVVVDAGSADVQVVTETFRFLRGPSWSSDGRDLYFVADPGGSTDLYRQRMDDDGAPMGSPRSVTVGVGMEQSAVLSPDGSKLAYSKGRFTANLWRVPLLRDRPATWADARQITFEEAYVEFVDVSPDGERFLISSDRTGDSEIWMLAAVGGELQQLTDHPGLDNDPKWSPDGTEVAFYSNRAGDRDIWVMPASGGPSRRLTEGPGKTTDLLGLPMASRSPSNATTGST